ncbi:MAG: MauE/DoxX family redox-associated membrane protein [Puniceicoccaceae bacterium]
MGLKRWLAGVDWGSRVLVTSLLGNLAMVTLAAVFAFAGTAKIIDPVGFYQSILDYRLLGESGALIVTAFIPVYELVLALALLLPGWREAARISISLLLGVFILAILQAWVRGIDLRCGCFGGAESTTHEALILRDFVLLGLAWMIPRRRSIAAEPVSPGTESSA